MAQTPGSPIGGMVVKGGKNPGGNLLLFVAGGINTPGSSVKTKTNLVNGYAVGGNIYVPLFGNGGAAGNTSHFFTIGLNAGGEYFAGNGDYDLADLQVYNITGQSALPSIMVNSEGNKQNGFKGEVGAQANFSFGQFTLSPVLNAAYFHLKQNAFSVTQSNAVNGTNYNKEIYSQGAGKTTGFALIPKLRVAFFPGKLGFYLEGNYTVGPDVKNDGMLFKPQGKANDMGFYSQDQMAAGTSKSVGQSAAYNSFGVNFGVSVPLGNSTGKRRLRGKVIKTGDNGVNLVNPLFEHGGNSAENPMNNSFALVKPGNPIGGIIVKGGKNPGPRDMIAVSNENGEVTFPVAEAGEYIFQILEPGSQGKSISSKGVTSTKNKRKGRTYTAGRKNETPNQDIQASPGNPIGGIIVKGGKNPGPRDMIAVSNENGEVTFPVAEAGEYIFQIIEPGSQGKSISSKGVTSTKNKRKGRTYTAGSKNEVSDQNIQSAPGNPIGGIIVKGGKNPGGSLVITTSNDKGEFELKGLEAGSYQFTLTGADGSEGKSINEKGVTQNDTSQTARPGSPIGGIVVKGGKNPGGNMINLKVDQKNTIQFEVLKAGDYKFIIQTPGKTNGNKKVKEKASSGLKDTLKTNV
ncbi:hypothetical protein DBR40_18330 [Pedobacter sp. KBW01]|nr:hypothetical protein DBR40_18330 [Pedobacter sp. KBW01]